MGRRNYWNAVRMIAEDIRAGDRRYWNLTKNPDLPTSGVCAIEELHEQGLVKASSREDRVEPTEAFWPWLEELQQAEAQQAATQWNQSSSARQPPATAVPTSVPASALEPPEGTRSSPRTVAPAAIKARRPRIKRPDLDQVNQMCVKIIDFMNHKGHQLPLSTIRRGVNAHRYPEVFDFALRRLQNGRAIKIEKEPGSRREWATLLEVPQKYEATRLPPKRRRHAPRSRGQTAWFQEFMAERELED